MGSRVTPSPRPPEDESPAAYQDAPRRAWESQLGVIASVQMGRVPPGGPPRSPGKQQPRGLSTLFLAVCGH